MISLLKGTIASKDKNTIVVFTSGGVGYAVNLAPVFAAEVTVGSSVEMSVYTKVSDSDISLYGFRSVDEKSFFSLLLSVSGVGPKSAMNILSIGSIEEIQAAISRGDATYLSAVQGIGKKTAERMVVELKSKVKNLKSKIGPQAEGSVLADVIDGLVAMGYSKEDAKAAAVGCDPGGTVEEILKEALQRLAR